MRSDGARPSTTGLAGGAGAVVAAASGSVRDSDAMRKQGTRSIRRRHWTDGRISEWPRAGRSRARCPRSLPAGLPGLIEFESHRTTAEELPMTDTRTPAEAATGRGRIRIEQGAKRVRAYLGGEVVADTIHPVLVWEVPYYPAYYFPVDDVRADALEPDGGVQHSPSRGDARTFTVTAGGKRAAGAAWRY